MMSKEHLTYFKVENFKRFDSLELNDIGQFNLIVGDNNVGKTTLLESLLISDDAKESIVYLNSSLSWRGMSFKFIDQEEDVDKLIISMFKLFFKDKNSHFKAELHSKKDSINKTCIKFSTNGSKIEITTNENPPIEYSPSIRTDGRYFPFISYSLSFDDDLLNYFSNIVNEGQESLNNFISLFSLFLSDLSDIRINKIANQDVIIFGRKDKNDWMPLQMFGDGVKRLFRIALETSQSKGKRLMIDEVDTGIHYSRMIGFLKNTIKFALINDVQLFMTTHSLECQQAFAEVFEAPDMVQYQEKVRQFTLIEKPDGQVIASGRDFEQLQSALVTGYDTRGGERRW